MSLPCSRPRHALHRSWRAALLGAALSCASCTTLPHRAETARTCAAGELPYLDELPCPEGTQSAGAAPPDGTARWCERPDGTKHGPMLEWYPGGQKKSEVLFDEGRMHGPSAAWHENGNPLSIGCWKNGEADGAWTYFDEQGGGLGQETYRGGARQD